MKILLQNFKIKKKKIAEKIRSILNLKISFGNLIIITAWTID